MSNGNSESPVSSGLPRIRRLAPGDIAGCLRAGMTDFRKAPLYGLFFGGFYFLGGMFILASLRIFGMPWMIIPVAIGFPLIGPFIAVGLYEVSRRLAAGEPPEWRGVLTVMLKQRERQLGWMAFVVLFIFWIWIYQVRLLLAIFLGFKSFSGVGAFLTVVTTTPEGLGFLLAGTIVGAVLAMVLFSATVISIPLLLDREIDLVSAIITSFRTVIENPVAMIGWGIVVTLLAMFAMLPVFAGLPIVLPVLGHATWHLYRLAVEPAPG